MAKQVEGMPCAWDLGVKSDAIDFHVVDMKTGDSLFVCKSRKLANTAAEKLAIEGKLVFVEVEC